MQTSKAVVLVSPQLVHLQTEYQAGKVIRDRAVSEAVRVTEMLHFVA